MQLLLRDLLAYAYPPELSLAWIESLRVVAPITARMRAERYEHVAFEVRGVEEGRVLLADAGLLSRIFFDLVVHAAEAVAETPAAGVRLSLQSGADSFEWRIEDSGPSVDEIPFSGWRPRVAGRGFDLCRARSLALRAGGGLDCALSEGLGGALFRLRPPALHPGTGPHRDTPSSFSL
jgi:C4-dicarboxylate-specific signal transduction histidine kinase